MRAKPGVVVVCAIALMVNAHANGQNFFGLTYSPITHSRITWLPQGWNRSQSDWFYHSANQGSHLLPYDWFLALEQPDKEDLLRDNVNIDQLRFIPESRSILTNPDGLPVGFVKDSVPDNEGRVWIGLTCAACHTSQIEYQDKVVRIDGGPGQGDIQTFQEEITAALHKTHDDKAKFLRFTKNVLGAGNGNRNTETEKLRDDLQQVADFRSAFDKRNRSTYRYGFARVDAFGIIMNEVFVNALDVPKNQREPNAPVSYPFLWDTPQHDFVQWNAIAPNHLLHTHYVEPLARNVGEVLGVFGEVEIPKASEKQTFLNGYDSSVRRVNLLVIEELLKQLTSPAWPGEFPPLNRDAVVQGEKVFRKQCIGCHQIIDPSDLGRTVKAERTPIYKPGAEPPLRDPGGQTIPIPTAGPTTIPELGTDPLMAWNFAARRVITGPLEGKMKFVLIGPPMPAEESARDVLVHVVIGTIVHRPFDVPDPIELLKFKMLLGGQEMLQIVVDFVNSLQTNLGDSNATLIEKVVTPLEDLYQGPEPGKLLVYKGRPLNGIWATAPYLHNGSVPNLQQLLLPASERVDHFYVGSREFDPVAVGFKSDASFQGAFEFRTKNEAGEPIPGNSNAGHEYGKDLTPTERAQLLEFLKSL